MWKLLFKNPIETFVFFWQKKFKDLGFLDKEGKLFTTLAEEFCQGVKETVFLSSDKKSVSFKTDLIKISSGVDRKMFENHGNGSLIGLSKQCSTCRKERLGDNFFFEKKFDSKGYFYLTEKVSTTLSKPFFTCPEDYCDSAFKKFLVQVFGTGINWFQIFGRKLGAVLSKTHLICQWDCFEVFWLKKLKFEA